MWVNNMEDNWKKKKREIETCKFQFCLILRWIISPTTKIQSNLNYECQQTRELERNIDTWLTWTLFILHNLNVVFLTEAEDYYFCADFRLKTFCEYSYMTAYDISVFEGISVWMILVRVIFRASVQISGHQTLG